MRSPHGVTVLQSRPALGDHPSAAPRLGHLRPDLLALVAFLSVALVLAMLRFKKRLD